MEGRVRDEREGKEGRQESRGKGMEAFGREWKGKRRKGEGEKGKEIGGKGKGNKGWWESRTGGTTGEESAHLAKKPPKTHI